MEKYLFANQKFRVRFSILSLPCSIKLNIAIRNVENSGIESRQGYIQRINKIFYYIMI